MITQPAWAEGQNLETLIWIPGPSRGASPGRPCGLNENIFPACTTVGEARTLPRVNKTMNLVPDEWWDASSGSPQFYTSY